MTECSHALALDPPAKTMPILRHFWKRQNWQRLRCALVISQLPSATHVYTRLFCTVRLKKPLQLKRKQASVTNVAREARGVPRGSRGLRG